VGEWERGRGGDGRAVSFDLGAVPRVPAPMPETHMKSSVEGVGTGALPLQNDDLSENETALGEMGR